MFTDIDFEKLIESLEGSRLITFQKNTMCAIDSGRDSNTWLLKRGVMFSLIADAEGSMIGNALYSSGDIIFSSDEFRTIMCFTLTECHFVKARSKYVHEVMRSNAEACYYVAMFVADRYTKSMQLMRERIVGTLEDQIAAFDARLEEIGKKEGGSLGVSDAIMAKMLGRHPVSISRARARMHDKALQGNDRPLT